jgi:hypothetical protein
LVKANGFFIPTTGYVLQGEMGFYLWKPFSMKISLKSISVLAALLLFVGANAQQDFNLTDFSNKLNKVIAAKRQGFKPFLKVGSDEVDRTKFVELVKGGSNRLEEGKYSSSLEFESKKLISVKAFMECLRKAYLPNECIITQEEGKARDGAFTLVVIEKANGYYNIAHDYYSLYTEENTDGGNHQIVFHLSINSKEEREIIFNKKSFAKQMQEIVGDQKNAFASYKNGKKKTDTTNSSFLLKRKIPGSINSELGEELNDDSTGMDTYFINRFRFALPLEEKISYASIKSILKAIYPTSKYDIIVIDSAMEGETFLSIRLGVVELFKDRYRVTKDIYIFEMEEGSGWRSHVNRQLDIRVSLKHFANKEDADKVSYLAGNGMKANDSLKKIVTKLYTLSKNKKLGNLNATMLKESELPGLGDFSFGGDAQKLTSVNMKGYSFYKGNNGEFAIVKKLGKNATKHHEEWLEFIQQVGNALPRNFVYLSEFHSKYVQPDANGKRIAALKAYGGSSYTPFLETKDYAFYADNLMSVFTNLAIEENEREEKTVYAIINITAN